MTRKTIPQRDLRNNIGQILHEAEAGTIFTVTVRGRPVARLGPPDEPVGPRTDVSWDVIREILAMPIDSEQLTADLDAAEAALDDPWGDE
jgi:prevent-host-death family protein